MSFYISVGLFLNFEDWCFLLLIFGYVWVSTVVDACTTSQLPVIISGVSDASK